MQIIKMPGPLAKYREDIEYWLEQFAKFEEHRHFMVHAIMVPVDANHIMFKMYDHREGEYKIGELLFKLTNLEFLGKEIGKISNEFPIIVDSICKSVPFQKG